MRVRRLPISGDIWVEVLKDQNPQRIRVTKNRLPEDARCIGIDIDPFRPHAVYLRIESAVFGDDDPDILPDVHVEQVRG